jgi:predicted RND superfamily exporter protein
MDVLDSEFGGAGELTIWVRSTDQQGVLSTRHLQSMYELEKRVLSYQDEEGLVSLSRGIGIFETLRLLHESRDSTQTFDEFMNDDIALTRFVMQMSLARPDWSSDVVSVDQRSAKFVFRLPWQPAQKYVPLRTFLEEERDALVPKGLDAKPLGVLFTLLATFGVLVDELIVSFGVAVVVISLLMMFFLRSIRLGIISLIPNLIPIILTLGCMSFLGIHLDLGTVLFASIVLGICVDDTIHLLHHFRLSYESHGRVDDAIKEALSYAGKAILVTSVLLIFCMGIYLFSDLASLQRFGGLMLVSVVFALISDLLCTPIVLRFVYRDRIEE